MARPTTISGAQLLVYVEEPAGSGTFIAPCGLTTKGFNQSKATNDTNVPDCDDPDAPSYLERDTVSLSAQLTGSGVLAEEAVPIWRGFFEDTEGRLCRINVGSLGYYLGEFVLSAFNITGERGNRMQVEVTLDSDGQYTWTDA